MRKITVDLDAFMANIKVSPDFTFSVSDLDHLREYLLAHDVVVHDTTPLSRGSILEEADDIVNGQEQKVNRKYGKPGVVFQEYANIFNSIAPSICFDGVSKAITAVGIAYVLKSIKLGREKNHHKRDNLVDDTGYTEIIAQLHEGR